MVVEKNYTSVENHVAPIVSLSPWSQLSVSLTGSHGNPSIESTVLISPSRDSSMNPKTQAKFKQTKLFYCDCL